MCMVEEHKVPLPSDSSAPIYGSLQYSVGKLFVNAKPPAEKISDGSGYNSSEHLKETVLYCVVLAF